VRLSTKTRYGVRAIFDIAFHNAGAPTQAKDIARREEIPLRYLEQIFQELKRAGIVDSRRGPRGGYYLRQPPTDIRLGDIVRALQGPIEEIFAPENGAKAPATGRARKGEPPPSATQVTAALWRELGDQITRWFDGVTVDDLVKRGVELGVPRGDNRPMYFI
jgi:Rrf2 family transcriptional regulator, iron-sulfur cluster assembly transcription factor